MAGKLTYLAPIENASGKIFGLKTRFVSVTRQSGDRIRGCAFMGKRDLINHPVSQDEMEIRMNFTKFTKMVAARIKQNSPRWNADHALFKKQTQFDSFKKWLWAQVKSKPFGVDYAIVDGSEIYPGAPLQELNVSTNNKLSLQLIPGTGDKLTGTVQVKVNGIQCTNPTVEDDMLTVTLPASLDGVELMTVVVTSNSGSYRLEY